MKFAIIADDLTGANDSGVQLTRFGLRTAVLIGAKSHSLEERDAVVFDTDSRSLPQDEAYRKVKEISEFLHSANSYVMFKKIDSTMRGNVGAEVNAIYDVCRPDFAVIAPAYPAMGRQVIEGYLYVNGKLVHETEVGHDPKTAVKESFLPRLIEEQSKRRVGHISSRELSYGPDYLHSKLAQFKSEGTHYLLVDAAEDGELQAMAGLLIGTRYSVVWAGSAGLANVLPSAYGMQRTERSFPLSPSDSPVLLVVGSVSRVARKQLQLVLSEPNVTGIKLHSHLAVADERTREAEWIRVYEEARGALAGGNHIALYSSGDPLDIEQAVQTGNKQGMDAVGVSNVIADCLGRAAFQLIHSEGIGRMVLAGGDTAKRLLNRLDAVDIELLDEVEPGIPLGRIESQQGAYVITKAGSFGSETALVKSLKKLSHGSAE
ncbi:four-carbon acid sugar kinase family protein [Paenibacillus chartarius]|uniref:Four-carbon acid sugar kinase family protein n=1 Tax=Paenibacillus chartarius TaxID=747481 RepID=A0ABV6DRP8_9BACL